MNWSLENYGEIVGEMLLDVIKEFYFVIFGTFPNEIRRVDLGQRAMMNLNFINKE